MKKYVILAAGGSGTRMNAGENKIFLKIGGKSVLERSILLFDNLIDRMVIVCKPDEKKKVMHIADNADVSFGFEFVTGGDTRQHSVLNGLAAIHADPDDLVIIHDAARCMTPLQVVRSAIESCFSCNPPCHGKRGVVAYALAQFGRHDAAGFRRKRR